MAIDIKKLLPANVSTEFWEDYCDSWSDELILKETELIDPKEYYYNTRYQETISDLITICNTFGYTPDRSLDESVEYMQKEVKFLNYRVKYKSTYTGYDIIFSINNYSGLVYNLYLENNTLLIRGLDISETIIYLDNHTYSLPFIYFQPDYYYSTVINNSTLDQGYFLDTGGTLDGEYVSTPTQHLAIEYSVNRLVEEDSLEYWVTTTYLEYLANAVNYNRKSTEIPHIGFQFNFISDFSYTFNNLSLDNDYTVPVLKMQGAYVPDDLINTNPVFLDAVDPNSQLNLDDIVLDSLDQNLISSNMTGDLEVDFYKIVLGDGGGANGVGLPSINYPDLNNNLIAYYSFDESGGATFEDTANTNDGTLYGTYNREINMLNQGITFDGLTGYGETTNLIFDNTNKTFSFWFRFDKDNQDSSANRPLVNIRGTSLIFGVNYLSSSQSLAIRIGINTFTTTLGLDGGLSHIVVNLNRSANTADYYINGTYLGQKNISSLGSIAGASTLYIAKSTVYSTFSAMSVDEIRIYDEALTIDEMEFLYTNKQANVGIINEVFETTDLVNTRVEDIDWYIIAGRCVFNRSPDDDDQEEEITVSEFIIENQAGTKVFYASFPPATFKKKYHFSYQLYLKK